MKYTTAVLSTALTTLVVAPAALAEPFAVPEAFDIANQAASYFGTIVTGGQTDNRPYKPKGQESKAKSYDNSRSRTQQKIKSSEKSSPSKQNPEQASANTKTKTTEIKMNHDGMQIVSNEEKTVINSNVKDEKKDSSKKDSSKKEKSKKEKSKKKESDKKKKKHSSKKGKNKDKVELDFTPADEVNLLGAVKVAIEHYYKNKDQKVFKSEFKKAFSDRAPGEDEHGVKSKKFNQKLKFNKFENKKRDEKKDKKDKKEKKKEKKEKKKSEKKSEKKEKDKREESPFTIESRDLPMGSIPVLESRWASPDAYAEAEAEPFAYPEAMAYPDAWAEPEPEALADPSVISYVQEALARRALERRRESVMLRRSVEGFGSQLRRRMAEAEAKKNDDEDEEDKDEDKEDKKEKAKERKKKVKAKAAAKIKKAKAKAKAKDEDEDDHHDDEKEASKDVKPKGGKDDGKKLLEALAKAVKNSKNQKAKAANKVTKPKIKKIQDTKTKECRECLECINRGLPLCKPMYYCQQCDKQRGVPRP